MSNVVIVQPITTTVVVEEVTTILDVTSPGPQGAKGDTGAQGAQGPQGIPGTAAGVFYTHTQNTPLATWTIDHNLGNYVTAIVYDSANNQVEGAITQPSTNQIVITFSSAFSGYAYII